MIDKAIGPAILAAMMPAMAQQPDLRLKDTDGGVALKRSRGQLVAASILLAAWLCFLIGMVIYG